MGAGRGCASSPSIPTTATRWSGLAGGRRGAAGPMRTNAGCAWRTAATAPFGSARCRGATRAGGSSAGTGSARMSQDQKEAEHARRDVEERYRLAAMATNDAVWDRRPDRRHDRLERQCGGDPRQRHLAARPHAGRWWTDRIHPDDKAGVLQSFEEAIEGGDRRWSATYRFRRDDGSLCRHLRSRLHHPQRGRAGGARGRRDGRPHRAPPGRGRDAADAGRADPRLAAERDGRDGLDPGARAQPAARRGRQFHQRRQADRRPQADRRSGARRSARRGRGRRPARRRDRAAAARTGVARHGLGRWSSICRG